MRKTGKACDHVLRWLVAATFFSCMSSFQADAQKAAQKPSLAGRVYEIELMENGTSAGKDRIYFSENTCDSRLCREYGFVGSTYSLAPAGDAVKWRSIAISRTEGTAEWRGRISDEHIEGTLSWSKAGQKPVSYTYTGRLLPSLYDRLGGTYAIAMVVDDFIDRLLANKVLNANPAINTARERVPAAGLKYRVTALVCQAAGGPEVYAGRPMREAHRHLNITEQDWDAMAADFKASLNAFKVPPADQDELFAIIGGTKKDIVMAGSRK